MLTETSEALFVLVILQSIPVIFITRCLRMCLAHDLAESIVGDITPSDGISKEEKFKKEKVSVIA